MIARLTEEDLDLAAPNHRRADGVDRAEHATALADRLELLLVQNVTLTEAALRFAAPWYTASMLLPAGSITKAA